MARPAEGAGGADKIKSAPAVRNPAAALSIQSEGLHKSKGVFGLEHANHDAQLLLLLQTDPEAGLRAAMQVYAPLVKAVCARVLPHSPQDAEECMADAFVALWRNTAALAASGAPLRAWLAVTARNKAINRYNDLRRARTVPLDDGLDEILGELAAFDRAATDAEDLVGALVAAMEPPDREIFLRRYYLLQPAKEIAAALGMSENTVNVRLHRGRERLRRTLLEQGVSHHA